MTKVYIVRGECSGAPESYIFGVYPTAELAQARVDFIHNPDGDWNMEFAWFDIVEVGAEGSDCVKCNR